MSAEFSECSTGPRVLHVVPALFGSGGVVGGAERYALELARNMATAVPTRLLTFGDHERSFVEDALPIRVIGRTRYVRGQKFNPFSLSVLPELRGADIIHCHQKHIAISTFLGMAGRAARKRVFVTDLGGGGWDISSYVNTDRLFNGHLHISEYSRRVFRHSANRRARVIGGGVDVEKFSPTERERENRVLYVGRLLPHKGIDVLIRAMPADLELEIIGRPYDSRYFNDLQRLAEGKRVTFRQDCEAAELIDAYRSALCIVLPSVYTDMYGATTTVPELLGQTLLEGMACGTPAIGTDVASIPEIIQEGASGFIVSPSDPIALGDRIARLAADRELVRRMGLGARERVLAGFRWDDVVGRCLEAYS